MSAERDVNRIVRSWLRTDEHDSADAILGIVLSRLDTTPQRRSRWPVRRSQPLNTPIRLILAAAAAVTLAVVGLRFLPAAPSIGTPSQPPLPTAGPTSLTTRVPTPSPAVEELRDGALPAGRYRLTVLGSNVDVVLTLGGGWSGGGASPLFGAYYVDSAARGLVSFWTVEDVGTDACDIYGTTAESPIGATVDDLVSALAAQRNSDTSEPAGVTVGGYPGKRLTIRPSTDVACDPKWWISPYDLYRGAEADEPVPDDVYAIDVDGQRIVIVAFIIGQEEVFTEIFDSMELTRT